MDSLMEVLHSIDDFKKEKGYAPSIRELCIMCNLKSTSTMHARLEKLKCNGYLVKEDKLTRCLNITEKGKVELNAYNKRCRCSTRYDKVN